MAKKKAPAVGLPELAPPGVRKKRAGEILKRLRKLYPGKARSALESSTPLEMLVATILSAQCTDKKVNEVTQGLFGKYRTARDYADADAGEFEKEIRATGFFRQKTKSIQAACRAIAGKHGGKVPRDMGSLVELPGVGRKTANVVKSAVWGDNDGIAVDTHVGRLSRRLGFSGESDPLKVERDLMGAAPKRSWGDFSFLLIRHGRDTCSARRPKCPECVLADLCPSAGRADGIK